MSRIYRAPEGATSVTVNGKEYVVDAKGRLKCDDESAHAELLSHGYTYGDAPVAQKSALEDNAAHLKQREDIVLEREQKLAQAITGMAEREDTLRTVGESLAARETELSARAADLANRETDLTLRAHAVEQREAALAATAPPPPPAPDGKPAKGK